MKLPECEKLREHLTERETVEAFLRWLRSEELVLARWCEGAVKVPQAQPISVAEERTLALRFLGVDAEKLEAERQALLRSLEVTP